ncbi:MAG: hypothetical protein WCI74_19280, partial [Actinomycetes bacterium]
PGLASAVATQFAGAEVRSFTVPSEYLYGYASSVDPEPVRLYRLSAAQLRSLVTSDTRMPSDSGSPAPVR